MNLGQAIFQVRLGLDGLDDDFWSDAEITEWLNEGAQLMCSLAQLLIAAKQISTVAGQQEYALPPDVDEVDNVSYNNGTQLRTMPTKQAMAQIGNAARGTPMAFYLRNGTMQFMNHGGAGAASTADIVVSDIPSGSGARKAVKVIGLYPIPSMTGQIMTVTYYQRHYWMQNSLDEPAIPAEFQRGIVDFATAKGKAKETAYAEHDKYMLSFKDYSQRLVEKWQNGGQEVGFHRMQVRGLNRRGGELGGSSWIYVGDVT